MEFSSINLSNPFWKASSFKIWLEAFQKEGSVALGSDLPDNLPVCLPEVWCSHSNNVEGWFFFGVCACVCVDGQVSVFAVIGCCCSFCR